MFKILLKIVENPSDKSTILEFFIHGSFYIIKLLRNLKINMLAYL